MLYKQTVGVNLFLLLVYQVLFNNLCTRSILIKTFQTQRIGDHNFTCHIIKKKIQTFGYCCGRGWFKRSIWQSHRHRKSSKKSSHYLSVFLLTWHMSVTFVYFRNILGCLVILSRFWVICFFRYILPMISFWFSCLILHSIKADITTMLLQNLALLNL